MFENFPLVRNVKENSISVKDENIIVRKDINVSSENEQNMMRVRPKNISCINTIFTTFQCLKSFIYKISNICFVFVRKRWKSNHYLDFFDSLAFPDFPFLSSIVLS